MSDAETLPDPPSEFNEEAYLTAFPKIAENVRAGLIASGLDHYTRKGAAESRLQNPRYRKAMADLALLARLSAPAPQAPEMAARDTQAMTAPEAAPAAVATPVAPARTLSSGLDALLVSLGGLCLAIGWVDDRGTQLSAVAIQMPNGRTVASLAIARCRRLDAEGAIGCQPGPLLGFYALVELGQDEPPGPGSLVHLHCGEATVTHPARPNLMQPEALRDAAFEYLAAAGYMGNPAVESFLQLQGGIGDALLRLNQGISSRIAGLAYVERHGPQRRFRASVVVCLYGRPEYLFLQAAAFSAAPGAQDYEYIYVCNSPELTEALQREARMAALLYGLSFTLVFLPGNAGFGAANNAAAMHAASDRVLITNPDVFPRSPDWAARHAQIVENLPAEQTRLWGAPLFYDDGSLMHGGMFFASDTGLSVKPDGILRQTLLRVEHYGKGAPPGMALYQQSRPVPAVTGAFISADRAWFERIGGFSEEYVFGHYEDADICLKSWQEGGAVWMHNLPLWHLEGKGSSRRAAHEGGSTINRWHFTRGWLEVVQDGFEGPQPERLES